MIQFKTVNTKDEIIQISNLAGKIFKDHFTPIIGSEQVDYMLSKFQSEEALTQQINSGYKYVLVLQDNDLAGYFGIKPEGKRLFLSKFYLDKKYRGIGISRKMLEEIINTSKGVSSIYLTVNKQNEGPINIYKKFGFEIIDSVETDIGSGFIMDDYIMEKILRFDSYTVM